MIEPNPTAPEGSVLSLPFYRASDFQKGAAILCRNTAPLVSHAYGLLLRDVPCRILGRDIGAQLAGLVKKLRAANLEDLLSKLQVWESREAARLESENKSPERVYDQAACIRFFVQSLDEDSQSVPSLLAKIDILFSDDPAERFSKVLLSTVHKAKGLEFATVFLLDRHLIPSRYATQPWQRLQERNLLYVAVTRAMERLIYIRSESWKDEE